MSPARLSLVLTSALAIILGLAAPAAAHVTVQPGQAAGGGYAKLAFRVPTESATASTVKLTVTFPTDRPLATVRPKTKPGWKATVTRADLPEPVQVHGATLTEAVHTITWDAQGDGIAPDMFDEFEVSVGPLPDSGRLVFDAAQTYSDGTVVRWNQTDADAEHPAPVLTVTDPPGSDASDASDGGSNALALGIAIGALAVGLVGLGIGIGLLVAAQRRPESTP